MRPILRALSTALAACTLAAPALADRALADRAPGCASGPASNASRTDAYSLAKTLRVVGLAADGRLLCFSDARPGSVRTLGTVSGFTGDDTRLVGLDFRPQDGLLYGVGNAGGLYRVDTGNGQLAAVGQLSALPDPAATAFGVDFNPAANALRIVSSTGQNLRQSFANFELGLPLAATAVDSPLGYTTTATPGPLAAGIAGAAYTNNDLVDTTGTSLFVLDTLLAQAALQSPANAGFLVATGKLGATPAAAGFDIYSVLRGNVTVAQRALAALTVDGTPGLYDVDLLRGAATLRGTIGAPVVDIAVPLNQY